jgi:hypothetical protein
MTDHSFDQELREARKIRLRAQAAGRYLDALVRHMNRTRKPWQRSVILPVSYEPQIVLLPHWAQRTVVSAA